ncbi:MAG: hypothetical protein K8S27_06020 [Candidatus Omnitrophica bacterium]|nr:hypothetical protein [Candidatus Omnitrophota bacterium]
MKMKNFVVSVFLLSLLTVFVFDVPFAYSQPEGEEEEEEHIQARPNPLEKTIHRAKGLDETRGKASLMIREKGMAIQGNAAIDPGEGRGGKAAVNSGPGKGGKTLKGQVSNDGNHGDKKIMHDAMGDKATKTQILADDGNHGDGKILDDGAHGDQILKDQIGTNTVSESMNVFNNKAGQGNMNLDPINANSGSLEEEFGGSMNLGQ